MNKIQAAEQFRRVVQMMAAQLTDAQAREVPSIYPRWVPGAVYPEGTYLTAGEDKSGDPILYKVIQAHTSQEDWSPAATPALYACISLNEAGWPIWSPPTGAHDAYNIGDIVSYNGKLWRSKIDGNVTEPGSGERMWSIYEEV